MAHPEKPHTKEAPKKSVEANKDLIDKQGFFSYEKLWFDAKTGKQILQLRYGKHVLDTKIYGFEALLKTAKLAERIIFKYMEKEYHYYAYGNLDGVKYEKALKITDNNWTVAHNTAILHENTILSTLWQTGWHEKDADAKIASEKFAEFLNGIKTDMKKVFSDKNTRGKRINELKETELLPVDITKPMINKLIDEANDSLKNRRFDEKKFTIREVDNMKKGYELRFSHVWVGIVCSNLDDIATILRSVTKAFKKFDAKKHLNYETDGGAIVIRTDAIIWFNDTVISEKEISKMNFMDYATDESKTRVLVDFLNNGITR